MRHIVICIYHPAGSSNRPRLTTVPTITDIRMIWWCHLLADTLTYLCPTDQTKHASAAGWAKIGHRKQSVLHHGVQIASTYVNKTPNFVCLDVKIHLFLCALSKYTRPVFSVGFWPSVSRWDSSLWQAFRLAIKDHHKRLRCCSNGCRGAILGQPIDTDRTWPAPPTAASWPATAAASKEDRHCIEGLQMACSTDR